jgi:hypothetical protein
MKIELSKQDLIELRMGLNDRINRLQEVLEQGNSEDVSLKGLPKHISNLIAIRTKLQAAIKETKE